MRFPFALGSGPMGGAPSAQEQAHTALRELQGRGAYSVDPDSLRDRELASLSVAPGLAMQALWRATAQAFPQLATESLDEWEEAYRLRDDAGRSTAERQARIVSAERAIDGAQPARILSSLRAISPTAATASPSAEDVDLADCTDGLAMTPWVSVPEADYADQAKRTALEEILRRQLPARSWGQSGRPDPADCLGTGQWITWGDATSVIGRETLAQGAGAPATPLVNPPARVRDFGPLVKPRAADLNAIQEGALSSLADGSSLALPGAAPGQEIRPFSVVVSASDYTLPGVDWRDRWILLSWAASSTVDIRPDGGGAWPEDAAGDLFTGTSLLYTGTGGSGTGYDDPTIYGGNVRFYVDASTGVPTFERIPGTGTIRVVGFAIVTTDLGER